MSMGLVVGFLGLLAWASARSRRRGIGASMMGPFEEMYHPAAAQSHVELRLQTERKKPLPSPEDL
nr:hypothetical protein [Kribbella catacumbae]